MTVVWHYLLFWIAPKSANNKYIFLLPQEQCGKNCRWKEDLVTRRWINLVFLADSRRRRVNPWSTPWRSAPTGCTRRSNMTASVCKSTRTATTSATSAAASSRCCRTKLVCSHSHTHTHKQTRARARAHTRSLGSCPVITITSGYNLLSSAPCWVEVNK